MTGCTLLPGFFGVFVQGLLFAASCGVLIFKKKQEERNLRLEARSWPTFLLDSSKQLLGSAWVHAVNMMCAVLLGVEFEGDGCEWYWVNIMVDTTLGVGIEYMLLWILTEAFETATLHQGIFRTGDYKDAHTGQLIPFRYFAQLGVWLLCITFMKFAVVILMLTFHSQFQMIAHGFITALASTAQAKLVVVMVLTPCIMNAFQFWLTDNFIKKSSGKFDQSMLEQAEPDAPEVI